MSTLTTTHLATLPRVNLLPPEIGERRRFRHVQAGLGAGVLASLLAVGALFLLAAGQVDRAQEDLDANVAEASVLQAQVNEFAEVPLVYAQVEAAQAQVGQAMGQEIRWSYYLNDLSLKTPNRVWLESMTVTQTDQSAAVVAPVTGEYATPGIGSIAFDGRGYSHNDVAAWLDSLARQKGYTQPYFTDSTVSALADKDKAVTFTSTVTLTEDALSRRYTDKAGS